MYQLFVRLLVLVCCVASGSVFSEIKGKVDLGAANLYIDMLKSGKTEKTLKMNGVKADATILVYQGIAIKPNIIWAEGGHGRIATGGIAIGQYLPITDSFKVLPNVGMAWSDFYAKVRIDEFGGNLVKEYLRSKSPFIGLDLSYTFNSSWSVIGYYQYAWSKTVTTIKQPVYIKDKSHSCGSNFGAAVEYAFNDHWAINLGAGYNSTLSKEKHGLRGKGVKLGLGYYF